MLRFEWYLMGLWKGSLLLLGLVVQSCLYSTHRFHSAKILHPGETQITTGMGPHRYGKAWLYKYSIDYSFGAMDTVIFFRGLQLGIHLEAPTNPGTLEFNGLLGLPAPSLFHQYVELGWGIGMWADNSLFAGYGLSWDFK